MFRSLCGCLKKRSHSESKFSPLGTVEAQATEECLEQMKNSSASIPEGYRETPILISADQEVMVVGLAKLDYSQSADKTCEYLKAQGVETVFGMHYNKTYTAAAKRHDLTYNILRVRDFSAPEIDVYDAVFNEVLLQAEKNKRVAIHCWGGVGRTGTILAALKLCEMSMFESFYQNDGSLSCTVHPRSQCTKNVESAIRFIRSIRGSEHAIEDPTQVESLVEYEQVLKDRLVSQLSYF